MNEIVYKILGYAALLITLPFGVKLLDYLISAVKTFLNKKKEDRAAKTSNERELDRFRLLKDVDVSETNRKEFQAIKDGCLELARHATERAHAAEERARLSDENNFNLHKRIDELDSKFENLDEKCQTAELIRDQIEINFRLLCDTFNVAHWEILPDGQVRGNSTFFKLTGLHISRCHNDGWFEAVEESARETVKSAWDSFIESHQTRPAIKFTFRNVITQKKIETVVYCGAVMKNLTDVYKFTAQTKPLEFTAE